MAAARKRAVNAHSMEPVWRKKAYGAINICFKQMFPDADRDERLAWISDSLGLSELRSTKDLSDAQLGSIAGRLKELTGVASSPRSQVPRPKSGEPQGNVVRGDFGRGSHASESPKGDTLTVFLASAEQVYTLEKLAAHIKWTEEQRAEYLRKRYRCTAFRMLTYDQAKKVVNAVLHIAAHRNLKIRNGGGPVSRAETNKHIPILKRELQIDR
jgi:hypothetical protein